MEDEKIFLNKIKDKLDKYRKTGENTYLGFLDMYSNCVAKTFLKKENITDYELDGGFLDAERKVLFFPKKHEEVFSVIEIRGENLNLNHRAYLGAVIKCGLERDVIGDICVLENGADIITLKEKENILLEGLQKLDRFSDATFKVKTIDKLQRQEAKMFLEKVIVSSYRLDNFVSELAHTSRSKATMLINQERVFVNGKPITKQAKEVKLGDILTIRSKGRFVFKEDIGLSRSKKHIVLIEKYV